ncbi:MAG: 50S ribosomal protein L11 [Parcubacteria group bacterium GW2011_GWC1_41_7]|nr:MAG: 50S ribosomal protein L11 [Parcubacteria group bacterium GW2011_GWC1_41_7]
MAKEVKKIVKVLVSAGAATPAPPIGPSLAQHGVNIQEFCTKFNAETQDKKGQKLPVVVTIYEDRTFDYVIKMPPVADLLKKITGIEKGSGAPNTKRAAIITEAQVREVAEQKMEDLNADSVEAAMNLVKGTARSMGIRVEG